MLTIVIQVVVFAVYLLFMLLIGFGFYNTNNTLNDYFLGGRGLNKWVAAMSAQASDERLAALGIARHGIFGVWGNNRSTLDSYWIAYRYIFKLAVCC